MSQNIAEHHEHHEAACSCGCCTVGAGHSRKLGNSLFAIVGAVFILDSYALQFFFPDQVFASKLSAALGALILFFPIASHTVKDLLKATLSIDSLVALAILAAMINRNFQTAGIIAFFLLISVIIESGTAIGAQRSIEQLVKLTPRKAKRLLADASEEEVDAILLQVGDLIRVRPGENFPVDGVVVSGKSVANQASVTGESVPADKEEGEDVFAGTTNLTGALDVKVTKVGSDTTLGKVKEIILAAERSKTPITRMLDRYIAYYVPTVLMLAGLVWLVTNSMERVVSLLIISCPCALIIATPSAIVAAVSAAARLGILINNGAILELAAKVRAIAFDKTGTLTEGKLSVSRVEPVVEMKKAELLRLTASLESNSNHPIAKAVLEIASKADIPLSEVVDFTEFHGKGVTATLEGKKYLVGRRNWLKSVNPSLVLDIDVSHEADPLSMIYVAEEGRLLGWIGFLDALRPEAKEAVGQLVEMGFSKRVLLTGDRQPVAELIAKELEVDGYKSDCLPDEKVKWVEENKRDGFLALVGDGINDAPALTSSDLGIAFGKTASDIAVNSAPVSIISNDLRCVPMLFGLARKAKVVMNVNLGVGTLIIVFGVALSAFGMLPQILAAILHTVSTLVVIFNSAGLIRFGENFRPNQ